jgi:hypothetical protein
MEYKSVVRKKSMVIDSQTKSPSGLRIGNHLLFYQIFTLELSGLYILSPSFTSNAS